MAKSRKQRKLERQRLARSKKASRVRVAGDFDVMRLTAALSPPRNSANTFTWSMAQIVNARDQQLRGDFHYPARLAASMRTDDALFTALENRLAPQRAVEVAIEPARGSGLATQAAREAEALYGPEGLALCPDDLADVNACVANHGVAFMVVEARVRADGSRVDLHAKPWPIEFVRWSDTDRCWVTRVDGTPEAELAAYPDGSTGPHHVPIVHGDGRWIVVQKHGGKPWQHDAAVLPGALVWARHAHALRDWAKGSVAHGNAKVVGKMPEGVHIQDSDGNLTEEAQTFIALLNAVASLEKPVGLAPAGAEVEYITNNSRAWEVWERLVLNAEKAAARIYLGTDGMLGAAGGAPGVDIATLFGVATTIVQGDLKAIEDALRTGLLEPWAALNFGDSRLAPRRRYLLPDPDAEARRERYAANAEAFHADVERHRANGFIVDQKLVDDLAERYGVTAPRMAPPAVQAPQATPQDERAVRPVA